MEITTDGSMIESGQAGCAAIIRISKDFLPIKLVSFLSFQESSVAELCAAILAFAMLRTLNCKEEITWISDSKTTQDYFSKQLGLKYNPKHLEHWQVLDNLSSNLIVCCRYSNKHKDLIACDKASRWAANLGNKLEDKKSLVGKNNLKDPRYAWQVVDLSDVLSQKEQILSEINVYNI